ncbi:MAG: cytochrome c [Thermodesulfovibrionales bacterium]|nr:cytochrome c [Thermodesulfovibrionales bacterium]
MLIKSYIAILFLISVFVAMFSMFEVLGRKNSETKVLIYRKIHRFNGVIFFVLYLVLTYLCLEFIVKTKTEPSARASLHSLLAISIIILLFLKISFIKRYTEFFKYVKGVGITLSVLAILTFSTSAGFYLLVSELGAFNLTQKITTETIASQFDLSQERNILRGKDLFTNKCSFCHDANSKNYSIGPGLKGLMKEKHLPVSKKPVTAENIITQLKTPLKDMPSFSYLSEEELKDLISYLNTI